MDYFELKKRAMLLGANVFWLPAGVGRNNVLAAYRFKGVSSEAFALQDLSNRRNNLIKYSQTYNNVEHTPAWSSANGFSFDAVVAGLSGYLDNPALDQSDIKSAVVCYTGVEQDNRALLITAGGASGKVQIFAATSAEVIDSINDDTQEIRMSYQNYKGPGFVTVAWSGWASVGQMAYSGSAQKASGVIGVNFTSNQMFLDGSAAGLSYTENGSTYTDIGSGGHIGHTFGNSHSDKNELSGGTFASKTIIAAAFYDVELTADQHLEVANAMLSL